MSRSDQYRWLREYERTHDPIALQRANLAAIVGDDEAGKVSPELLDIATSVAQTFSRQAVKTDVIASLTERPKTNRQSDR